MDDDLDPSGNPADFDSRFGEWGAQNIDSALARKLAQDPISAINSLVNRGIAPPDFHAPSKDDALPFAGAGGNEVDPTTGMPIFGPDGKMMGNLTSAQGQPPQPVPPQPTASMPMPAPRPQMPIPALSPDSESPLDPVPLPQPRPAEAGPGASDISAKKKPAAADALSDFSKSLQGVKPIQPPPVNPVGTPSVRNPGAISAPNVSNLLALQNQAKQNAVLPLLGRLLAMGKV